jgi:hypothetical protein
MTCSFTSPKLAPDLRVKSDPKCVAARKSLRGIATAIRFLPIGEEPDGLDNSARNRLGYDGHESEQSP